jgi:hypothetical protein
MFIDAFLNWTKHEAGLFLLTVFRFYLQILTMLIKKPVNMLKFDLIQESFDKRIKKHV